MAPFQQALPKVILPIDARQAIVDVDGQLKIVDLKKMVPVRTLHDHVGNDAKKTTVLVRNGTGLNLLEIVQQCIFQTNAFFFS